MMGLTYKKNVADLKILFNKVFNLKKNFHKFNCYDPLIIKFIKKNIY